MRTENQITMLRGSDWARLHAQLIWAYHDKPSVPRFRAGPTPPPLWWIRELEWGTVHTTAWLLTRGSVRVTTERGEVVTARRGQWMFPMGRARHQFSADAQIVSLAFCAHWPDNKPLYRHHRPVVCSAARYEQLTRAGWALVRLGRSDHPPGGRHTAQMRTPMRLTQYVDIARTLWRWIRAYDDMMQQHGLVRTLLGEGDERVAWLQQRIEMLPLDEPFDVEAAAKSVGMSVSQLNRIFVRKTGMTPHGYHQRRRLRFAMDMLRETATPIKQLAFMVNFQRPTSFSNWFRKHTGRYPRDFRKNSAMM